MPVCALVLAHTICTKNRATMKKSNEPAKYKEINGVNAMYMRTTRAITTNKSFMLEHTEHVRAIHTHQKVNKGISPLNYCKTIM